MKCPRCKAPMEERHGAYVCWNCGHRVEKIKLKNEK